MKRDIYCQSVRETRHKWGFLGLKAVNLTRADSIMSVGYTSQLQFTTKIRMDSLEAFLSSFFLIRFSQVTGFDTNGHWSEIWKVCRWFAASEDPRKVIKAISRQKIHLYVFVRHKYLSRIDTQTFSWPLIWKAVFLIPRFHFLCLLFFIGMSELFNHADLRTTTMPWILFFFYSSLTATKSRNQFVDGNQDLFFVMFCILWSTC